jgi:hypothetical protein
MVVREGICFFLDFHEMRICEMTAAMQRLASITALLFALFLTAALPARAQDQGPMAPPPKFEVKRIPSVPHPGPPPLPEQVIIQKFAAAEDVAKKVYDTYNCTQTIRIEELSPLGGKFTATGELYTRPDGARYWRVIKPPESNLKNTTFSIEDVRTIFSQPLFFLTSDEIGNYDFLYAGQHKLDEINTYVFQVKPKVLSRTRRFFQGVIYVDDHDLAIVETYGKFVSEIAGSGTKLLFTMFDTYRENFQERYWLPTYITSDDYISGPDGTDLHLRLVLRSTNFQLNSPPAAASPSPPGAPANHPAPQN